MAARGPYLSHIAIRLAAEGVPINVIQRAYGSTSLDVRRSLEQAERTGALNVLPPDDWNGVSTAPSRVQDTQSIRDMAVKIRSAIPALTYGPSAVMAAIICGNGFAANTTISSVVSPHLSVAASYNLPKVQASRLRKWLAERKVKLVTIWGQGYKLSAADLAVVQKLIDGDGKHARRKAASS